MKIQDIEKIAVIGAGMRGMVLPRFLRFTAMMLCCRT